MLIYLWMYILYITHCTCIYIKLRQLQAFVSFQTHLASAPCCSLTCSGTFYGAWNWTVNLAASLIMVMPEVIVFRASPTFFDRVARFNYALFESMYLC